MTPPDGRHCLGAGLGAAHPVPGTTGPSRNPWEGTRALADGAWGALPSPPALGPWACHQGLSVTVGQVRSPRAGGVTGPHRDTSWGGGGMWPATPGPSDLTVPGPAAAAGAGGDPEGAGAHLLPARPELAGRAPARAGGDGDTAPGTAGAGRQSRGGRYCPGSPAWSRPPRGRADGSGAPRLGAVPAPKPLLSPQCEPMHRPGPQINLSVN